MVDISSQNNKINITVSSSGNTANTNVTPDYAQYYSEKSKEWAISNRIVDNIDYSSKYYANESKKQADISTAKATEVVESGNNAVSNIESARNNAITDITNQESLSVDNVNTAGVTQVANINSEGTTQINLAKEQVTLATNQANIAKEQANIATNKTSEVVASGNEALSSIDTAKTGAITDITNLKNTSISDINTTKDNAITTITTQETTSKTSLIDEGATQIGLIQNEGATQIANVQSTGFYMRDDKLYYINSQGEETEFKSGGGLEICDIGTALYVDETKGLRRYLNGQIVDINTNTQAFLNRLKQITTLYPSLLCTEDEWQAIKTASKLGQCGKFVYNYGSDGVTVTSIRLPAVVNINGLIDMAKAGLIKNESLPNITGRIAGQGDRTAFQSASGAFYKSGGISGSGAAEKYDDSCQIAVDFNASRSSSTYQDNAPVQEEAIQYPYFIQVATGSETENNIINDIELNNPYSLFDSKYSDHELNNLSWLKSSGQWNAKAAYPTAYDKLLKVYNGTETVAGLSVKLSTETYTDYDFVLNTADETFRLPLKTKQKFYDDTAPVVGNGMTLGLTDGTNNFGFQTISGANIGHPLVISGAYGQNIGTASGTSWVGANKVFGVTTDPTKSGLETHLTEATLYLYFYIGETVQNANLIDAGRIGEQLATKTDMQQAAKASMPSNRYIDLTPGATGTTYIAPADGWIAFAKKITATGQFVNLSNNTIGMSIMGCNASDGSGSNTSCFIPCRKGDEVVTWYSAGGDVLNLRFIYAEGVQ